jgi:hypothetical protein
VGPSRAESPASADLSSLDLKWRANFPEPRFWTAAPFLSPSRDGVRASPVDSHRCKRRCAISLEAKVIVNRSGRLFVVPSHSQPQGRFRWHTAVYASAEKQQNYDTTDYLQRIDKFCH